MKQRIIFATGNKNKIREIHEILGDLGWEILSMKKPALIWILWKMEQPLKKMH